LNPDDPANPKKPVWFDDIFDNSYSTTANIPSYLKEVSFGNLNMIADAYPSANDPDSLYRVPVDFSGYGSFNFYETLLNMADSTVDFSNYDLSGGVGGGPDGVVDLIIVQILGYGAWNGKKTISLSGGTYNTDDGVSISAYAAIFEKIYGVEDTGLSFRENGMSIAIHELGHHIQTSGYTFFRDTDHFGSTRSHLGAGSFGKMNNSGGWRGSGGRRSSPYNPYYISGGSKGVSSATVKQGVDWITPTDITSNSSNYTIGRFFQDTTLIRLAMPSTSYPSVADAGQTFLIARYDNSGLNPPYSISRWPIPESDAILIWHTNAMGTWNERTRK